MKFNLCPTNEYLIWYIKKNIITYHNLNNIYSIVCTVFLFFLALFTCLFILFFIYKHFLPHSVFLFLENLKNEIKVRSLSLHVLYIHIYICGEEKKKRRLFLVLVLSLSLILSFSIRHFVAFLHRLVLRF